jgi:hypothetical protein
VERIGRACSRRNLRDSTQSTWAFAMPVSRLVVVAVGGVSLDIVEPIERRERVWSLIVVVPANRPPKEDSVGQRNDHCTGSNKVD